MKRRLSKVLSGIMSVVLVLSSVTFYGVTTKAELTTEQMAADAAYNLALKKTATANPSRQEGEEAALTDGSFDGKYAATTFNTINTYFLIDLGQAYDASKIDQIVTRYKENNKDDTPVKGYEIQFSANGLDYYTVKKVNGADVTDACTNNKLVDVQELTNVTGVVRYVKLCYPDAYGYGIQANELAVLDVNGDAEVAEIEKCDDAAGVTVISTDYNKIVYNITAGENQEGYKYIVYLDGVELIANGVAAGTDYTIESVSAGVHTLKVYAAYEGKLSEGIDSEGVTVADISELINSEKNVANTRNNALAEITSVSSFYADHNINTAQKAVDGSIESGEGNNVCLRTDKGSPQNFVVDLGDYYTPVEFEKILIGYSNPRTYASATKIEFSLDGITYTTVGSKTGYVCKKDNEGRADINEVILNKISDYTEKAVRFVKVTLSAGSSDYGYVINEFALIANTEEPTIVGSDIPEAADIIVTADELEKIKYTIVAGENQTDAVYVVKLGKEVINQAAVAGTEYTYEDIVAGDYEIKVCTLEDGWLSRGIAKGVTVDGYINYIADSLNLAYREYHPNVVVTTDSDNKKGVGYIETSQEISAGVQAVNNGVYTDYAHHSGYLQTCPDRDNADIDYDLGKDYKPTDINSVIGMYEGQGNAATEYEILFSATGEKGTFERVFYAKDVKFNKFLNDKVDVTDYTQETVRYIKYKIITGNYGPMSRFSTN